MGCGGDISYRWHTLLTPSASPLPPSNPPNTTVTLDMVKFLQGEKEEGKKRAPRTI